MTTFAEKNIVFPDGQLNVAPLPEAVMINGFTPETRDAPGMPLPAQYLNWLFRDIYRKASRLEEKNNTLNERVIPAWMPIACPMADAPAGYLKCNGAAFDKELYPELAMGYPSGKLPDLRGEFIRGWDDRRGVDERRSLLSSQLYAIEKIVSSFTSRQSPGGTVGPNPAGTGAFTLIRNGVSESGASKMQLYTEAGSQYLDKMEFDSSRIVNSANETRPRNIAFNYIVRAA